MSKKNQNTEPATEQAKNTGLPAPVAKTADEYINEAVAEVSKTDIGIEQLKEKYGELSCNSLEDRPVYFAIVEGYKTIKGIRTAVENKRKELNEFPLKYQRAVNAEAKRITDLLTPMEVRLLQEKQKFEDQEAAAKAAEENRKKTILIEAGFKFDGHSYMCGVHIIPAGAIAGMEDGQIEYYRQEAEKIKAQELAAEKRRLDQLAEIEKKQKEADDAAAELERKKKEFEKEKAEFEEFKRLKAQAAAKPTNGLPAMRNPPPPPAQEPPAAKPEPATETPAPTPMDALNAQFSEDQSTPGTEVQDWLPDSTTATHSAEYLDGFEHCRSAVLAIFADPTPRTRSQFVEAINNVKP